MGEDEYLRTILSKYRVDTGEGTAAYQAGCAVYEKVKRWAGDQLRSANWSGSYAKGTAISGSTDIDLFISLKSSTTETLEEIFDSLHSTMKVEGYPNAKKQNVSVHVRHKGLEVDIVPGKHYGDLSEDHWLYVNKSGKSRIQTNVDKHLRFVKDSGHEESIRVLKIWRQNHGLDFLSFYLELVVIEALSGCNNIRLGRNVMRVLNYLAESFVNARFIDPANTNNIISDQLTQSEKNTIARQADASRKQGYWENIVW